MNVTAETYGHAVILSFKGDLTEDAIAAFDRAVSHQLENNEVIDVLINLESIPFLDSAALEYLLSLQERLSDRLGQVKLIKPDGNIRKILEITRLAPSFEVFEDVPEAVRALQG